MQIGYLIREGISGVRRTPIASAVTLMTIIAALTLAGAFTYTSLNFDSLLSSLRQRVELEAFLLPLSAQQTDMLQGQIIGVPGVDSAHYVSPQSAAEIFQRETGENVAAILDSNPLPASFHIALRRGNTDAQHAAAITATIQSLAGVDTVLYRQEYVAQLDSIAGTMRTFFIIGGALIMLISIVLTVNTIRLAIYAKRGVVQTLHLVGATNSFIRIPFLLEGLFHGALASLISIALLAGLIHVFRFNFFGFTLIAPPAWFFAGVAALGVSLGLLGSVIAVLRFLKMAMRK